MTDQELRALLFSSDWASRSALFRASPDLAEEVLRLWLEVASAERRGANAIPIGCICPPGANLTCNRADCPRKVVKS